MAKLKLQNRNERILCLDSHPHTRTHQAWLHMTSVSFHMRRCHLLSGEVTTTLTTCHYRDPQFRRDELVKLPDGWQKCVEVIVLRSNCLKSTRFCFGEIYIPVNENKLREINVHVTVHRNKFLYNKTNRRTNFPNLFWLKSELLHISASSSAHHQEYINCKLGTGICHTGLYTTFEQDRDPGPARKLSTNLYDIYQCQVYS